MRIFVTGTRGIPSIPGGIESHCEELYPRLSRLGYKISLIRRTSYICNHKNCSVFNKLTNCVLTLDGKCKNIKEHDYQGVEIFTLFSPKKKSSEAIIHTLLSLFFAKRKGIKYLHVHAIGPSLVIPLARLLGLKVVMTHHGPDYDRQKWGKTVKKFLKLGEWCAVKFANEIIVISQTINTLIKNKYKRNDAHLIHNAVIPHEKTKESDYVLKLGLSKQKYIIAVGRFVPEKGWHDLISASPLIKKNYRLVFVGDTDHPSPYSDKVKKDARKKGIVLTGYITGNQLHQIYSHAALFVMPSYHEGLPIALLEAMSYNLKTVVSNIPANAEVDLPKNNYFEVGNVDQLAKRINEQLRITNPVDHTKVLKEKYDWDIITEQTYQVYKKLMNIDDQKEQSKKPLHLNKPDTK